jgi:hypothetical protein
VDKPVSKEETMTLSLLMYALMMSMLVMLVAVLVVDAVRGLRRASAQKAAPTVARPEGRPATSGGRTRGVVPTRS